MTGPAMPENQFEVLSELALDLRWSWSHSADSIWKRIDPELWEATQNPWLVLNNASATKIGTFFSEPDFAAEVRDLLARKRQVEETPAWFQNAHPAELVKTIAYFSMEFMLSEALPIYSGGLGNVAGDQLKAASDLGVPVVGVGLLYSQGYFRQEFDSDGNQQALYPFNDPDQMPIRPVRMMDGEWLRIYFDLPGGKLWLRAWEVQVGRRKLYLLDSNDPANLPAHRCITSELYGGGPDLRLKQEIILGIGGWRLLRALGIDPEVCHLNEGHAAFAAVERARCFAEMEGVPFAAALTTTRIGNIFTTHTAVAAGFDRFAPELIEKYLGVYAEKHLGISVAELLALGRRDPADTAEPFNMAYLATRCSGAVSAVSALHAQVSRKIFQPLFPHWPEAAVPVDHVTNGIHVRTWDSAASDAIWTEAVGRGPWLGDLKTLEAKIRLLSDARLWAFRNEARKIAIGHARKEYARRVAEEGGGPQEIEAASAIFSPDALTLGFARRFATYKRANLLLHDPERLVRILTNAKYPVQLMLAGKAHPQDGAGQALIKQWNDFARRREVRGKVVFLRDYDMTQAQFLVQGCDVWINTPQRPWEASGTSGMKILANGGLNLSELDGWWAEAYAPDVGWAIGDGQEHGGDPAFDAEDANTLYALLENDVIPEYYNRDAHGIPAQWIERVRTSMARLTPRFSANRAVREYTENFYLPAAKGYSDRAGWNARVGIDILEWREKITRLWPQIRFGAVRSDAREFLVHIHLGPLEPDLVRVELYADPVGGGAPVVIPMTRQHEDIEIPGDHTYAAHIPQGRPASDYTPRIVPFHYFARLPLEAAHILWQR